MAALRSSRFPRGGRITQQGGDPRNDFTSFQRTRTLIFAYIRRHPLLVYRHLAASCRFHSRRGLGARRAGTSPSRGLSPNCISRGFPLGGIA